MGLTFWSKVKETDIFYKRVQSAAREGLTPFMMQLNDVDVRRGFWKYLLDKNNFAEWPKECQKALFQQAWYEGFLTITEYPQAIAMIFAATSVSLFAWSFMMGASITLFTCVLASALICGASYMVDNQEDDLDESTEHTGFMGHQGHHSRQAHSQEQGFGDVSEYSDASAQSGGVLSVI